MDTLIRIPSSSASGGKARLTSPGWRNRLARLAWLVVWALLYRPTPAALHGWRSALLRLFGARVGRGANPYPSVRIWAPWNLEMGPGSCLAPGVDCYNVAPVSLGADSIVSQRSFLCTASHDFDSADFALVGGAIRIGAGAWVAAEAFVAPGVTVGDRGVVLARTVVTRDTPPGMVVGGNPARVLRPRRPAAPPGPQGA